MAQRVRHSTARVTPDPSETITVPAWLRPVVTELQAILALPEHYREVVALCSLGEMSYEQAASVIGCPVGTVRSRLNRAREILVRKLSAVKGPTANSAPNSAMAAR